MGARFAAVVAAKRGAKLALLGPAWAARDPRPGLFVLIYHRVGAGQDQEMDLPLADFRRQMLHLRRTRTVVHLSAALNELAEGRRWTHDRVAVTFDDGYRDVHHRAWPVLRRLGLPFTLFLATGFLDGDVPAPIRPGAADRGEPPDPLTWDQVRDMTASGLAQVGSHSVTHREFDGIGAEEAERECRESRATLGERLGVEPDLFAYPRARPGNEAAVGRHYRFAVAGDGMKSRPGPGFHPLRVSRTPVRASDGVFFFRRRLDGIAPLEDRLYDRLRRVAR